MIELSEKSLKARVINKHDTETNWAKATNFVPKAGELILYDPDASHTATRMKVGNGSTAVTGLPFIQNLPEVTTTDNGKVLRVVSGAWSVVSLPSASGVSF